MGFGNNAGRGSPPDKAQNIAADHRAEGRESRRYRIVGGSGSVRKPAQGVRKPAQGAEDRRAPRRNGVEGGAAAPPIQGRPPLSQQAEERKRRALALRRRRRETFVARLTLCLAVYAACCLIIVGFVFSLYRTSGGQRAFLVVADGEGNEICRLSPDEFNINGAEYISASALSGLYSFTLAGDKEKVNMYFFNPPPDSRHGSLPYSQSGCRSDAQSGGASEGEEGKEGEKEGEGSVGAGAKKGENAAAESSESEIVRLFKNSSLLEINGENVRLGAKILFTDDYYIPLELIENYFHGAIIERDGGKVTLSRNENARFNLRLHDPRT